MAGIDEAGYGPLLGPLIMSAVMASVPASGSARDLWTLLVGCVTARLRRRDPRLVITDSKLLSARSDGLPRLEIAALSLLAAAGSAPGSFLELVWQLSPAAPASLPRHPWYRECDFALPVAVPPGQLALQSNALRHGLDHAGIGLESVVCEVLTEADFNDRVALTRNKATVQFAMALRLMNAVQQRRGGRACHMIIDKQGGRRTYRELLMTGLEIDELRVLQESESLSVYQSPQARRPWRIEFRQGAERYCLLVAAASIVSKYLRELFMLAFNRYWSGRVPGLKPTAGYYQDGMRFLEDIAAEAERLGVDRRILVRCR